jgi:hypothetical protein
VYSERGDRYAQGQQQPGDPKIFSVQDVIRIGHYSEIGSYPVAAGVLVPFGGYFHPKGSLSSLQGDSGIGDSVFSAAFWPYANHETKTYFAIGGFLTAPTGSYDNKRSINIGQNRYQFALQAGYEMPLTKDLYWASAFDTTWSGNNNDYSVAHATLKQQALYTSQTGLRYDITPKYTVSAIYFYVYGGETSINNVNRNDVTRLNRYQFFGIASYDFGKIILQYGADIKTENGFIEKKRIYLRYLKPF